MYATGGIMIQGNTFFQAATVTGANNGTSIDPAGTDVQLGESLAAPTGAAIFLDDRLLPMDQFVFKMSAQLGGEFTNFFFNDTPSAVVLENDLLNSIVQSTEVSYKLRLNPGLLPPFDLSFESFLGQRNTGETFIRSRDLQNPPNASIAIVFELQNPLPGIPGVQEVGRFNTDGTFGVGTNAPFAQIHSLLNSAAGSSLLALENQTNNAASSADMAFINNTGGTAVMKLHSSAFAQPNRLDVNNTSLAGDILLDSTAGGTSGQLRVVNSFGVAVNGGTGTNNALDVNGFVNTVAPNGGVSAHGNVQFGSVVAAAVALDATRYWELNINGAIVKIAIVV